VTLVAGGALITVTPLCYTDLTDPPWRCPNRAAYEARLASVASHTVFLCVDCAADVRRDWPDDIIEIHSVRPPTPIPGIISVELDPDGPL
jgi:hypothetical protein